MGIKKLESWDFPDEVRAFDGWEPTSVPDNTRENIAVIIEKINEIIEVLAELTPQTNPDD